MTNKNPDASTSEHKKPNIGVQKNYTKPTLIALGSLQRVTLGGSDITTQDSFTGTAGPKP